MPDPASAALALVRGKGIRYVRFVWTDNAGLIRAKAVHTAFLDEYVEGARVGITPASQALPVMYDALASGSGLTPAGEVHLEGDWSTLSVLPYAPAHARVLVDIYDGDQWWAQCPRAFLRRMVSRLADQGLRVMAALENEFFLLRRDGNSWAPVDLTVFCQTSALDRMAPVLDAITAALDDQGILVEMLYAESGPGQFEMPIRYADAQAAADHQVVFRETVGAVAHAHGLIASFVPKIFADRAGSGAHLHFSLWRGDQNVTGDGERPGAISPEASAFVAGVLHHLPALMAITTPSPNSYKRIRPRFWSGAYTCWGYGNREGAIRVPPPAVFGAAVTNVELKTVDATCNPYLALGSVMAAGLDGIDRGLAPGEPVQMDPADLAEAERAARGMHPLPTSLEEAIRALEGDALLLDALGPGLAKSFLAVRRAEWEAMKDLSHEEEVRLLLERY